MKKTLRLAVASTVLALAAPVLAATTSDTFLVQVTVLPTCSIAALPDLTFANYDANAASTGQTTLSMLCNAGTPYQIGIDAGLNPGAVAGSTRAMTDGTEFLGYDLFRDGAGTQLWGTTLGVDTLDANFPATVPAVAVDVPIYGVIPAGQVVTAGLYQDATVTLTITY